jgi:siroheme synthase (precorrin-2 oxidase/ferrochelatase)
MDLNDRLCISDWEVLDLLRKLLMVGIVLLVGRGTVAHNATALLLSVGFLVVQISTKSFKLPQDNLMRASTEVRIFLVSRVQSLDPSHSVYDDRVLLCTDNARWKFA